MFKTKARSRLHLSNNDGEILDLNKDVYQEVEVSSPRAVIYLENLDNEKMLVRGDIEEADEVLEEDNDGIEGEEEEEDDEEDEEEDDDD